MKTMSYVKAVTLAVNRAEENEKAKIDGWSWINRWEMYMIISPRFWTVREI